MRSDHAALLAEIELGLRLDGLLAELASQFLNRPTAADLQASLAQAQRGVCELLDLDRCTLWHLAEPGAAALRLVSVVQPSGLPAPPPAMLAEEHFPYVLGELRDGRPVLLSTLDQLPPHAAVDRASFAHYGATATAIFPLVAENAVFAAITFAMTRGPRDWTPRLVRRLELVAQVFGGALRRWDLDQALQSVTRRLIDAQERERARLAQELHDGLSQQLAVLAVELQLLGMRPPATPADLADSLDGLAGETKALSADVHRLAHGLHPAKLERLGLVTAMGGFCRELAAAEALDVTFSADGVPDALPSAYALSLYRIMQEALWNVVKHAEAGHAAVHLGADEHGIHLEVVDDGRGFEPGHGAANGSLGLLGMHERAAMHGGRVRWERRLQGGTAVRVELPRPGTAP